MKRTHYNETKGSLCPYILTREKFHHLWETTSAGSKYHGREKSGEIGEHSAVFTKKI